MNEIYYRGKNDPHSFIFTLKNPHHTKPLHFFKRKESRYSIFCQENCGPIFGSSRTSDISIADNCNKPYSCVIYNTGEETYECHSKYGSSLYVNSNSSTGKNFFTVLDYEVYQLTDLKAFIKSRCLYADTILELMKPAFLKPNLSMFEDEYALLEDYDKVGLDLLVPLKISSYFFNNPSNILPGTTIVDKQYDTYINKWCGKKKWKLLYKASQKKSHDFCFSCSEKALPALVIVKSTKGWIFGGFATSKWTPSKMNGI